MEEKWSNIKTGKCEVKSKTPKLTQGGNLSISMVWPLILLFICGAALSFGVSLAEYFYDKNAVQVIIKPESGFVTVA